METNEFENTLFNIVGCTHGHDLCFDRNQLLG